MATEWFVSNEDQVTGPFTVAQLRAQAAAQKLNPDTRIRRGRRGKWYAAKNVKGLLAKEAVEASEKTDSQKSKTQSKPKSKSQSQADEEEGTFLAPVHNRKVRAIVWGCVCALVVLGRAPIYQQLIFDLMVGIVLGSYPIIEVKSKFIEQTIYVLFYPVYKNRWRFKDYYAVDSHADSPAVFWRMFELLMPWLGGTYKIHLKDYSDDRTVIWQGNNTRDYEANLALLRSIDWKID